VSQKAIKMVFGLKLLNNKCIFDGLILISFTLLMIAIISVSSETTISPITTTPGIECSQRNSSCGDCVKNSSCYYCFKTKKCDVYPSDTLKPQTHCGTLSDMAWKTCYVKFNILIIVFGSIGGALLLILIITCCCCCKKVRRAQFASQMAKWERQRADRKAHQDERRQEREARRNEIRQKYGLSTISNDNNKYKRFD